MSGDFTLSPETLGGFLTRMCFVIQRFDGDRYDRLYDEVFEPAIRAAEFDPYRVDRDPSASIPIDTIEKQISDATVCLAEISEDNPNVWFELGYALARGKPLCLVCAKSRKKFPFDVQHRHIIRYPVQALPNDYKTLTLEITDRLRAAVSKADSLQQNVNVANSLSIAPANDGLRPHELLALTIVFQYQYEGGISARDLVRDMERAGYTKPAAVLGLTVLKRKNLVEPTENQDDFGHSYETWTVSSTGEDWLLRNQDSLHLKLPTLEIRDEDIPF
jgi:hypothetical protein